jgi:hypothetical protein
MRLPLAASFMWAYRKLGTERLAFRNIQWPPVADLAHRLVKAVLAIHFMRLPTLGFGSDVRFQSGQGCPAIGFGTAWLSRRAATRSRITLAMAAMIVNMALPLGVGVSTASWRETESGLPPARRRTDFAI